MSLEIPGSLFSLVMGFLYFLVGKTFLSSSKFLGTLIVFKRLGWELDFTIVLVKSIDGTYLAMISSAEGLELGLTCNILESRVCNSFDYLFEIGTYFPVLILAYSACMSLPSNGGFEVHNSYNRTPADHISHLLS